MGDVSGLTLVELMIVLVLSLLLAAAVYITSQAHRQTSIEQHTVMTLQQDLRAVIDMMEIDLHNAGCDPLMVNDPANATFGIKQADPAAITLTFDANRNGVLDRETEWVRYELSGRSLMRSTYDLSSGSPQEVSALVADSVSSLKFLYCDKDGHPTGSLSGIRSIIVEMILTRHDGKFPRKLRRHVQCRNMRQGS
ncbi:MAG TPA: prepilin-type N-terminal cleavage/methylation domain-containing protein [Deltaproteobacteria bacterium]|nr:prepilin-type N-terminal cleavage/methylation domain-containing protein [Deltaproteobacteria bacterium]HOI06528.1 prepilin-type N-terminal cleavage/methylation domain-containing protein [Deltaproteobacteria bacterium]